MRIHSVIVFALATLTAVPGARSQSFTAFHHPNGTPTEFSVETRERKLEPLTLSPAIGFTVDSTKTITALPSVHAEKELVLDGMSTFQFHININPKPTTSDTKTVASNLKMSPGTAEADIAYKLSIFPRVLNPGKDDNLGFEIRASASGGLQLGDSLMTGGGDVNSAQFGVFSGQGTLALWLYSFYVAGQANYFLATGSTELGKMVNRSTSFSGALIVPYNSTDESGKSREYFFELRVGGDQNDTVYGVSIATSFKPF